MSVTRGMTPEDFFDGVVSGRDPEPVELEAPKVSLTTGDKYLDAMLHYRNKVVKVTASLIEIRADRVYEWSPNHWIPIAQMHPEFIIHGRVSTVQKYTISKEIYGDDYSRSRDEGKWIFLYFAEAYIENPNQYALDLMENFSTAWPSNSAMVRGSEMKVLRISLPYIMKIEQIDEEDSPISERLLRVPPIPSKYNTGPYGGNW